MIFPLDLSITHRYPPVHAVHVCLLYILCMFAGIAADSSGNIYFSDAYFKVVRYVDSAGFIRPFAGQWGSWHGTTGRYPETLVYVVHNHCYLYTDNISFLTNTLY